MLIKSKISWMQKNDQHHVNPQGLWNRALVHATRNAPELCQDWSSPAKGIATHWTLLWRRARLLWRPCKWHPSQRPHSQLHQRQNQVAVAQEKTALHQCLAHLDSDKCAPWSDLLAPWAARPSVLQDASRSLSGSMFTQLLTVDAFPSFFWETWTELQREHSCLIGLPSETTWSQSTSTLRTSNWNWGPGRAPAPSSSPWCRGTMKCYPLAEDATRNVPAEQRGLKWPGISGLSLLTWLWKRARPRSRIPL